MKCEICKKAIQETFLNKQIGAVIKDKEGKKHNICSECQQKFKTKKDILEKL